MSENKVIRLLGRINIPEPLIGRLNSSDSLVGNLNIHTMLTGDGRELELAVIEEILCWRRVNDVKWIPLFPLSEITPERGVDYFTEEDIDFIKNKVLEELSIQIDPVVTTSFENFPSLGRTDCIYIDENTNDSYRWSPEENCYKRIGIHYLPGDNISIDESNKIHANVPKDVSELSDRTKLLDKHYIYSQNSASKVWIIEHNLNKYPSVSVVDSANNVVLGDITYLNKNSLKLEFIGAFSGKAYLN